MQRDSEGAASSDALLPFVFDQANVRGALVSLDTTLRDIVGSRDYPPPLARALAELLAAAAMLAASLKLDGSLIVQLSGDGPARLIVVECNDALELRATAQWNADRVAALGVDASLAELAGGSAHGRLALTLDPRESGNLYQGIVSLDSSSIAASIEHYLATSEQLQSRLWLAANADRIRGLLLQRLPGAEAADDTTWSRVTREAAAAWPPALAQPRFTGMLQSMFAHDDVRIFEPRPVTFRCKCSAARVANALRIAGLDEVEAALAERGVVDVTCEFCNRRYSFGADDARALFARGAEDTGSGMGAVR
ncbi:MAG TPA: Hsp33 family molecular chaperone HslO, partial [Casimicrobiaceae bacterium]|nr:Hsp33 family molecular chaperone HslO [Casimicrobiaceae bacterium]